MKPLLEIASAELVQTLNDAGAQKTYTEGEEIFAQGDAPRFVPVIVRGKVKMLRYPEPGKELIIGIFHSGEIFAMPPAMDGKNYPATAVAMEETTMLTLPLPDFRRLLTESTEFSAIVMAQMCGLLRETAETIQNLATPSPENRVGTVLLQLVNKEKGHAAIKINVRRQDIAEMAGLATETAIRAVKRLEDKGLITIERGKILIPQPELLSDFLRGA
jgi:CRP/FNR family transcriptional regulator